MISTNFYRPPEFQYSRPNENRFYGDIADVPIGPNDARSIHGDIAGEMARRASDIASTARLKVQVESEIRAYRYAAARETAEYESLKAAFVEKYGATDPAASSAGPFADGDMVVLSDQAKAYLDDLQSLDVKRLRAERLRNGFDGFEVGARRFVTTSETMDAMSASGWDMRFSSTREQRMEALDQFHEMGNRLQIYGAQAAKANAGRDLREVAVKAGAAALTAGLEGPALFKVSDDGRIDFDTKGLEHLSPDAQMAAQLKRLVEIMSVRNGFSPLKGAVAEALKIQNDYIAAHPVVTGVVELPF